MRQKHIGAVYDKPMSGGYDRRIPAAVAKASDKRGDQENANDQKQYRNAQKQPFVHDFTHR